MISEIYPSNSTFMHSKEILYPQLWKLPCLELKKPQGQTFGPNKLPFGNTCDIHQNLRLTNSTRKRCQCTPGLLSLHLTPSRKSTLPAFSTRPVLQDKRVLFLAHTIYCIIMSEFEYQSEVHAIQV